MALTTYSGLLTALESWMNRTDLTAQLPDFITLFEARMNRTLRVPEMEATSTAEATEEELPLPSDFLAIREVRVEDLNIASYTPQALHEMFHTVSSADPLGYAIRGQSLLLAPIPTEDSPVDVVITYYQAIPALTVDAPTNWLLSGYPDAYLYGVLCVAGGFLRDDDRLATWKAAWDEVLGEIIAAGVKRKLPGAPLVARGPVIE